MDEDIETILRNIGDNHMLSVSFSGNLNCELVFNENHEIIGGTQNGISFDFDTRRWFAIDNDKILQMSKEEANVCDEVKQWRHDYIIGIITDIMTSASIDTYQYAADVPEDDMQITYTEPIAIDDSLREATAEYNNRMDSLARINTYDQPFDSIYMESSFTENESDTDIFINCAAEAFVSLNHAIIRSGGFKLSDIYEGIANRIQSKDLNLVDVNRVPLGDVPRDAQSQEEYRESADADASQESYPDTVAKLSQDDGIAEDSEGQDVSLDKEDEGSLHDDRPAVEAFDIDEPQQKEPSQSADGDEIDESTNVDNEIASPSDDGIEAKSEISSSVLAEDAQYDVAADATDENAESTNVDEQPAEDVPASEPRESTHVDETEDDDKISSEQEFVSFLQDNVSNIDMHIQQERDKAEAARAHIAELDHSEEITTTKQEIAELKAKIERFEGMLSSLNQDCQNNYSTIENARNVLGQTNENIEKLQANRDWLTHVKETLEQGGLL